MTAHDGHAGKAGVVLLARHPQLPRLQAGSDHLGLLRQLRGPPAGGDPDPQPIANRDWLDTHRARYPVVVGRQARVTDAERPLAPHAGAMEHQPHRYASPPWPQRH